MLHMQMAIRAMIMIIVIMLAAIRNELKIHYSHILKSIDRVIGC